MGLLREKRVSSKRRRRRRRRRESVNEGECHRYRCSFLLMLAVHGSILNNAVEERGVNKRDSEREKKALGTLELIHVFELSTFPVRKEKGVEPYIL